MSYYKNRDSKGAEIMNYQYTLEELLQVTEEDYDKFIEAQADYENSPRSMYQGGFMGGLLLLHVLYMLCIYDPMKPGNGLI